MNCRTVKKALPLYADDGLAADVADKVRAHLRECPACRAELAAFQQSWTMLEEFPAEDPEPDYVERFWERLEAQESWTARLRLAVAQVGFFLRGSFAYGVIAVCVLLVGIIGTRVFWTPPFVPPVAQAPGLPAEKPQVLPMVAGLPADLTGAVNSGDVDIIVNLDFIENLELLDAMDVLDDWELIEAAELEGV